jgi:hypothetical protein
MAGAAPLRPSEDEGRERQRRAQRAGSLRAQRQRERAGIEALALRVSALRARQRAFRR